MGFKDDLLEEMADKYARQLEQNDTECGNEDCDSTNLDVEIWVDDSGRFDGEARCLECNSLMQLEIDDSDAQDGVSDVTDAVEDLKDTLDGL